jgi:2'-phosphotransferase
MDIMDTTNSMDFLMNTLQKFDNLTCNGIIVFKVINHNILYAIALKNDTHYSFTKGSKDKTDHNILENALRECQEEGGFDLNNISIVDNYFVTENKINKNKIMPNIGYFLAQFIGPDNFQFNYDQDELKDMKWLSASELMNKMLKDRFRIVKEVDLFIRQHLNVLKFIDWKIINSALNVSFKIKKNSFYKSKLLSKYLRHSCPLDKIDNNGFVNVKDVMIDTGINLDELNLIVQENDKNRFEFSQDNNFIRARQGHSIKKVNVHSEDDELLNADSFGTFNYKLGYYEAIHATPIKISDPLMFKIKNDLDVNAGLSRMDRNDIHLVQSKDNDRINNPRFKTLIYVNIDDAILEGIKFYKTDNGCILSTGNKNGIIPSKFLRLESIKF